MSDFSVRVVRISEPVVHHPNADRLSIIRIGGFECISAKLEDGSHRYSEGDHVVYVPEGAIVPEYLLRQGFWDNDKERGILAGSNGDRVKALRLRGIFSQGILFPVERLPVVANVNGSGRLAEKMYVFNPGRPTPLQVSEGTEVAEYLGITKYDPPIPQSMAGEMLGLPEAMKFDFESIQKLPELFEPGEEVSVTEKLYGTCFQIGYIPGLGNPECFGGGDIYVTSKGNGAAGRAFKDNAANDGNVYVRILRGLLEKGLAGRLVAASALFGGAPIRLFGEVIGQGIQDLGYGLKLPEPRLFDVMIGNEFLPPVAVAQVAAMLGIQTVPVLYTGPFDLEALKEFRDGKDTLSNSHVREGIVIRSVLEGRHPFHGRKIGKFVSPDYLLRKGNATEFN